MRKTTAALVVLVTLATGGAAQAKDCTLMYYQLFLTPQRVSFVENATGGTFTMFATAVGDSIVVNLERRLLTAVESGEKSTHLVGEATIKAGNMVNELTLAIPDQAFPSGNRTISITSTLTTPKGTFQSSAAVGVMNCNL
jgi:hypothetical protein